MSSLWDCAISYVACSIGNGNGDRHHKAVVLHLRAARIHSQERRTGERGGTWMGRGTVRCIGGTIVEAEARVEAKWKIDPDRTSTACIIEVDILGRTLYWICHRSLLPPVGVATVAPPSPNKPKKGKAALPLKSDRVWLKSFV
ncbi:hypothetical protein Tco_0116601 [Tanacetum coccineum]